MLLYLFCWKSAVPLVCHTKRGQSSFLLQCCLIEGTDSFPPLITSRQPSGGKPWDMATFAALRQPIMEVNWNSWVEMFAGSAQWGDCCVFLFFFLLANSKFEVYLYNLPWLSTNPALENPHVCIPGSLAKWDGDDECHIILLWRCLVCQHLVKSMTQWSIMSWFHEQNYNWR